jgi:hypothetical protein
MGNRRNNSEFLIRTRLDAEQHRPWVRFRLREYILSRPGSTVLSRAFCLIGTRGTNLCCKHRPEGRRPCQTHDEDGVVREARQQGCAGPLVHPYRNGSTSIASGPQGLTLPRLDLPRDPEGSAAGKRQGFCLPLLRVRRSVCFGQCSRCVRPQVPPLWSARRTT